MLDNPSAYDGIANPDRISSRQDFARELSLLKEQAGLTVREVARALGGPRQHHWRLLRGTSSASAATGDAPEDPFRLRG
jgi:hypothetical protein